MALSVTLAALAIAGGASALRHSPGFTWRVRIASGSYAQRARLAVAALEHTFYNGTGLWHMCTGLTCNTKNRDWGSDTLTYDLYLRWRLTGDPTVPPIMSELAGTALTWSAGQQGSSDTVMWDAIADAREFQVTGNAVALAKAKAAFAWVDSVHAAAFGAGACPDVDYQWPDGKGGYLKTLETATNYIKAALLLRQLTGSARYLVKAENEYRQVRRYFLARRAQLYTVYVFDDGTDCQALPGRYFASVNGNMIWAGTALAAATGRTAYLRQAVATARGVSAHLGDGAGVYADLQADNDVSEPLIEAMYVLASRDHQAFAARWLLRAASAAGADQNSAGEFGRFFDGPPPTAEATAWQVNGGAALIETAAALDPGGRPADPGFWQRARFVADPRGLHGSALRISVTGRAIAIMGSIGAVCCVTGHARVYVDGKQTFDRTGIWQNMTSPSIRQPDQVLFAWRWRSPGPHTITIRPGAPDAEEGGSFFQMTGYLIVR
ncbi:MAG TPA: hypothetical protein VF843_16270 [Streptosporangiaceae bacterium]